jgi:hypothetical protein
VIPEYPELKLTRKGGKICWSLDWLNLTNNCSEEVVTGVLRDLVGGDKRIVVGIVFDDAMSVADGKAVLRKLQAIGVERVWIKDCVEGRIPPPVNRKDLDPYDRFRHLE